MSIDEDRSLPEALGEGCLPTAQTSADGRSDRERQWLEREVAWAAFLTDADRVRILRDLLRTADAIQRAKSPEEIQRAEEVRRLLDESGRARYCALIGRLTENE